MELILQISPLYLGAGMLLWLASCYWLVRNPEWIAALVLAFFFFIPALVDLALGGRTLPTGLLVVVIFGPPLMVSLMLRRSIVHLSELFLLMGYGLCILLAILANGLDFWQVKSSLISPVFGLIIYLSVASRPALYRLLWVYVLLIVVNTVFQGLQRAGFMWAYLPSERHLAQAGGFVRGIGLSGHFAMAGLYATVVFPVAATLYVYARNWRQKLLAAGMALLGLAGVAFAVLRAALLGAAWGGGYVLWRRRSLRALMTVVVLAITGGLVVAVAPPLREAALAMFEHTTTLDSSAESRPFLASMGLGAWKRSPVIGGGPNAVDRYVGHSADPHNTFVNVLAETGVIGLLVFLAILARAWFCARGAIRKGYVQEGTAMAGALLATIPVAFFHSLNYIVLFWFIPSLCLALGRLPRLQRKRPADGVSEAARLRRAA